jgi:hypothetical protein
MKRKLAIGIFIILICFASDAFSNEFVSHRKMFAGETEWFDQNLSFRPDFNSYRDSGTFQLGQHKFDLFYHHSWNQKDPVLFQSSFNTSYSVEGINFSSLTLSVTGENEIKNIDMYGLMRRICR